MLIIGFVVSGLIAVAAWIILARACQQRQATGPGSPGRCCSPWPPSIPSSASAAPLAVAVKAWWPVIWLAGLAAVIFLWQRASTAFFKGTGQP